MTAIFPINDQMRMEVDDSGAYAALHIEGQRLPFIFEATNAGTALTPEAFGCIGDGVTDDGAAFQDAINAGNLTLTAGKNYLVKNINIPSTRVISGYGSTITWGGNHGTPPVVENVSTTLFVQGTSEARKENVKLLGFTLVGSRTGTDYASTGTNEQDAVSFQYADGCAVQHIKFKDNKQDNVSIDNCYGISITQCECQNTGDAFVDIRVSSDIDVIGNHVKNVRSLVFAQPNVTNVTIAGNSAQTFGAGITGHGANWSIVGNAIGTLTSADGQVGANTSGIEIYETGGGATGVAYSGGTIADNTIVGRSNASGIVIRDSPNGDASNIVISGNYVEAKLGILLEQGNAHSVVGNNVNGTTGGGIWASGGTNHNITANTVSTTTAEPIVSASVATVISNNVVSNTSATPGIRLTSASTDTIISGNKVTGATIGIITYGSGSDICGNRVTSGNGAGISLQAVDAVVSANRISATSGEGILVSYQKAAITGNRITSGTHGVRVSANHCALTGNVISGMPYYGVNISSGATSTIVVGNNLNGNTEGNYNDAGTTSVIANNV